MSELKDMTTEEILSLSPEELEKIALREEINQTFKVNKDKRTKWNIFNKIALLFIYPFFIVFNKFSGFNSKTNTEKFEERMQQRMKERKKFQSFKR